MDENSELVESVSASTGLSAAAVGALLASLQGGSGKMAQFNHPELGGMGQWSSGMLMIGDFNNSALKSKVQAACEQLARAIAEGRGGSEKARPSSALIDKSENWWDSSLGTPSSRGGQNDSQYAYFPAIKRLAVKQGDVVALYDTGSHEIYGASQQQGSETTLMFESQHGTVSLHDLKKIN